MNRKNQQNLYRYGYKKEMVHYFSVGYFYRSFVRHLQVSSQDLPGHYPDPCPATHSSGELCPTHHTHLYWRSAEHCQPRNSKPDEAWKSDPDFKLYPELRKKVSIDEVADLMRKSIEVNLQSEGSRGRAQNTFSISFEGEEPQTVMDVVNQLALRS